MKNKEINIKVFKAVENGFNSVERLRRELKNIRTLELRIEFFAELDRTNGGLLDWVKPKRASENYTPKEMREILGK